MRRRHFLWLMVLLLAAGLLLWGTDTFHRQEAEPPGDALLQEEDDPARDTQAGVELPALAGTDAPEPPMPSPTQTGRRPEALRGQVAYLRSGSNPRACCTARSWYRPA